MSLVAFSIEERNRRWERVRKLMAERGVQVLVAFPQWMPGDALYLANRPGAVIFPLEDDPILVSARLETQAPPGAWIQQLRPATSTGTTAVPYGEAVAGVLKELGDGVSCVAVTGLTGGRYTLVRQPEGYANYTSVMRVRETLPQTSVVDGTPILSEARYVKGEEEIEAIRRSVEIAEASARALAWHARPGVSEAEVYARMMYEQLRLGAESAHVAWVGGLWGEPKPRVVGPPPGTMQTGWFVNNEIEPMVQGYTCQIDQPVCGGPAPSLAKDLFELGKAAFERACELMRPGATWGEVEEGTRRVAKGTKYEIEFLLHGRGLGHDGPMLIPTDTHAHVRDEPIRAKTVFILKPYAYPADTANYDERHCREVTWGDSVVVRDRGAERLGTRAHELISV
ncbi:MAG TPA: M24 family metallopeptidase [Chloroflexota bacterium]|nr:M24 family metallopeptidase [Chloroflexota bacterium]